MMGSIDAARPESDVTRDLSQRMTRLLAASVIADPKFPEAELMPRVSEIPFNHVGHQCLIDYCLLSAIIWGTVSELRSAREAIIPAPWPRFFLSLLAIATGGVVFIAIPAVVGAGICTVPLGFVAGTIAAAMVWDVVMKDFGEKAAEIKCATVVRLLDGQVSDAAQALLRQHKSAFVQSGDGRISKQRTLVSFMYSGSDPLPGLGWRQASELFICPAKSPERKAEGTSASALALALAQEVELTLLASRPESASTGWAAVVDANTITPGSCWLDEASRPFLFLEEPLQSPLELEQKDPAAVVRVYFGAQLVLAEHRTCATFLVRPYVAGASVALEMLILTIGPPVESEDRLRASIRYRERKNRALEAPRVQMPGKRESAVLSEFDVACEAVSEREDPFAKKKSYSNIDDLVPFNAELVREEQDLAQRLSAATGNWPGRISRQENWREHRSLTMPDNFFGAPECKASVTAAYEELSRACLGALEALGYDISSYKNNVGQWTINADSIANMVVGERIIMTGAEKYAKNKPAKKRETEVSDEA